MVKELFNLLLCRETAENSLPEDISKRVTLAAEIAAENTVKAGDEIHLSLHNGKFCFLDENERVIDADICANIPQEEAVKLSLVKACFMIRKKAGRILKAELRNPYSLVHHSRNEWCFLH